MKQNITAFIFSIIFAVGIAITNSEEIVWLTVPWLLPILIGVVLYKKKVNISTKVGFWHVLVGFLCVLLLSMGALWNSTAGTDHNSWNGFFVLIIAMITAIWIQLVSLIPYIISLFISSKR